MKKTQVFSASLISLVSASGVAALTAPQAMAQVTAEVFPADTEEKVIPVDQLSNFGFEAEVPSSGLDKYNDPLGQVTSVSQLSDVAPTDWAFQALQSLIERYGCISGYPDGTFRGNRAMTRYEFAAGVNQCLDRITELIAAATADVVTRDDLAVLERLQEEFAAELAEIDNRVDVLEARTAVLESQQFSTTTKLNGEVLFYLVDAFGETAGEVNNTVLQNRVRLNFDTSFTGRDLLKIRLQMGNAAPFNTATQFPEGRLSGRTNETFLIFGNTQGNVVLNDAYYQFPLSRSIQAQITVNADKRIFSPPITLASSFSYGPLTQYGRQNTMYFPIFLDAGAGIKWQIAPRLNLDLFAGSELGTSSNPSLGFFSEGYGAIARASYAGQKLRLDFIYVHSYSPTQGISTLSGSNAAKVQGAGAVHGDTFLANAGYEFFPGVGFGGSVAFSNARTLGDGTEGNAHVMDYRANLYLRNVFTEGDFGGLIVGIQPKLIHTSNDNVARAIGLPDGQRSDRDTGWHIEAFYSFPVNDNITITPGVVWLTAPNHDERNSDVIFGGLKTTFTF
jgi:hypothetical protein